MKQLHWNLLICYNPLRLGLTAEISVTEDLSRVRELTTSPFQSVGVQQMLPTQAVLLYVLTKTNNELIMHLVVSICSVTKRILFGEIHNP